MKILLVITHSKMAKQTAPWLAETARRQNSQLLATNCVLNPIAVPGRTEAWPLIEKPQKVRNALKETIDRLPENNVSLLPEIRGQYPDQEVAEIIKKQEIDMVYFPVNAELNPGTPDMQFGQKLLRNAPCDVTLVDFGTNDSKGIERILVPMDLAASGHAIKHIIKLGSGMGDIIPLHISPDFGGDSKKIAARELELQLKEMGMEEPSSGITPQVVMADGFHQGIIQTVRANDAIVLAGTSIKLIHELRVQLLKLRPQIADSVAIGVFRPSSLAAKTRFGRLRRRLKAVLPELTLADRVSLFDRIQGGSRLTPDFIVMTGLSVLIASFGLLADNSSVVIGAMLVAPFMTPIIGVGLALAQGNLALMKRSAIATGMGLIVGLFLSFTLGLLAPVDEMPLEVLARGDPDIMDMVIAFVSGMAAAYAVSRESVAESIVGVAIAAALVPPLACVGIMLANEEMLEADGAIILLITNLAAIALGAATVFRWLGVPGTKTGHPSYIKIRWISTILVLLLLILSIPLVFRLANKLAVGQTRPMSFRVSNRLKRNVNGHVDKIDGLTVMALGRSGSGNDKMIRVLLSTEKPVPANVIEDIRAAVKKIMGQDTPVLIRVFQNAVIPQTQLPMNNSIQSVNPIRK
ncbi:MAG TPA: TIGR00341 family protein [Phycisphaerales bacterium]|nr:TIGR00341 family protein [Phycisphaerales bacterium]